MKSIFIFASLLSLATALTTDELFQRFSTYLKQSAEECVKELDLPKEIIDRFITERQSYDIEPMGCLKACSFEKHGVMVNGRMDTDGLKELTYHATGDNPLINEKMNKLHDKCEKLTKHYTCKCQLAMEFINCSSARLDEVLKEIQ